MRKIAPTATVDPRAQLADDVEVGPGCYIGPQVKIGEGCRLLANVTIMGHTIVGRRNTFYPSAVMGAAPQDLKYRGEDTRLIIGDDNVFREYVTAHTGTELGGYVTEIGSRNQFQVGCHIAHDVKIGSHCILSNSVQIAGHVHVEDHVVISGLVGVQQFVTLGAYCFITGMSRCMADTPPYVIFSHESTIQGVNVKGLARWNFPEPSVQQLRELCKILYPKRDSIRNNFRIRDLYSLLPWARHQQNGVATLARRIREAEARHFQDEHCRRMIEFVKRSVYNGVHGRYLEACRRDVGAPPPRFFQADGDGTVPMREAPATPRLATGDAGSSAA